MSYDWPMHSRAFIILTILIFSFSAQARKNGAIGAVREDRSCQQVVSPKVDGSFCESWAYLKSYLSPLSNVVQILGDQPVVFLGDTHPNVLIKKWMARNLAQFKALGFTHVALEFLNSESQGALDDYLKNPRLRPQMVQLVAQDWGWIPEEHVQLIDAVHAAGFKILAIDNRNELDRRGLGNDIHLRNLHMAGHIENTLLSPDAGRVLVLTGKLHSALVSDESGIQTLPQILESQKIPSLSLNLESDEGYAAKVFMQAFLHGLQSGQWLFSPSGDYSLPTGNEAAHGIIFVGP